MPIEKMRGCVMPRALEKSESSCTLDQHLGNIRNLERELKEIGKKEDEILNKRRRLEEALRGEKREAWRMCEENLARALLPRNITALRKKFETLKEKISSPDITTQEEESLEKEALDTLEELMEACPHTFVASTDGYAGSPSDDYDDGFCGMRACLVCAFQEISKSKAKDDYETLVENEARLVKRDIRDKKGGRPNIFSPSTKWDPLPLKKIRELFVKAAGRMNIE